MGIAPRQEIESLEMLSHSPVRRLAFRQPGHAWTIVLIGMLFSFTAGCGVVAAPIAPEDIGIEAKVRAQEQAEKQRSTPERTPISPTQESEIVLPPLRPIGTQ